MRPHHLRLTAFGPFAGTVEVDLDALAANGLFLLRGETGAGKTTLLDGLGFALYGRVPGVRNGAKRLRSDHAPEGLRTCVLLEVTLGGRRLRITRSPQQERRKSRGEGTTTEQAKVLLEELIGSGWTTLSTRIDETAAALDPLLGMSADQFFQVVLLPQGEFAQFLRADSEERGKLLAKLFGTARFGAVEQWLESRRRDTGRAVALTRSAVDVLAARVGQAAGVPVPECEPGPWADGLLAQARQLCTAKEQDVTARELDRAQARRAAEQAGALVSRQTRKRALLARSAALATAAPAMTGVQEELAGANRAAGLAGTLSEQARREADEADTESAQAQARAGLEGVGLPDGSATSVLQHEVQVGRERTGRLEALRDVALALQAERAVVHRSKQEAVEAERVLASCADRLATLPHGRRDLLEQAATAQAAAVALPERQAEQRLVTAQAADARARTLLYRQVRDLREQLLVARERRVSLKERAQEVRDARFEANVYELANLLVDGDPCLVCGATVHPDPSELQGERVGREQEEAAREAAEQAARHVADLDAQAASTQATLAGLEERLAGVDVEALPARADELIDQLASASALAARAPDVAGQLRALEVEQNRLEARRATATADAAAAGRRGQEAGDRADRASARLSDELDGVDDLDRALDLVSQRVEICEQVLASSEAVDRASREARHARQAAEAAVHAAGFPDARVAVAATRDDAWLRDAERRLRSCADEQAAVVAGLADPELEVPLDPPADLPAATADLTAADLGLAAALSAQATAAARVDALAELVPQLRVALRQLLPEEERASVVRRLADLCAGGGQNTLKMSLSSFVLAARLEEVAAEASSRLLRMTQGRYSLVHTDAASRGGTRSGLGLLARDTWTGQDRDTSTLSGGETFLASLALALGLSDVVSAEAGGARLEALFVDEGFGSLDEDTLDEVMDVLDGLREGGRVVGVVSHVAELHQRIPAQVYVRKTRTGSDVVLLGC